MGSPEYGTRGVPPQTKRVAAFIAIVMIVLGVGAYFSPLGDRPTSGPGGRVVTVVAVAPASITPQSPALEHLWTVVKHWKAKRSTDIEVVLVLPFGTEAKRGDFGVEAPHKVVKPGKKRKEKCLRNAGYPVLANYGAAFAAPTTSHIVLMSLAYEASEDIVEQLIAPHEASADVHITGATLTTNQHGGDVVVEHGVSVGHGWVDGTWRLHFLRNLNGHSVLDARATRADDVAAVSPYMMMVRYSTWTHLDGMRALMDMSQAEEAPSTDEFVGWDLCLQVRSRGLRVVVVGANAKLYPTKGGIAPASVEISGVMERVWAETAQSLSPGWRNMQRLKKKDLTRVNWDVECSGCSGTSSEVQHLAIPLQKYHPVDLLPGPHCFCEGLAHSEVDSLSRMQLPPSIAQSTIDKDQLVVWISHYAPDHYVRLPMIVREPAYVVGRSTFDFTTVPSFWASEVEDNTDEVWVPSKFVRDVFLAQGVSEDKVHLVPEAVDAYFYDPKVAGVLEFPLSERHRHYNSRPFIPKQASRVRLFSHFRWEESEGWDVLLSAYFRAFARDDEVTLVILTDVWLPSARLVRPELDDVRDETYVRDRIYELAERIGKRREELPHFVVVTAALAVQELAALYNSVHAFVLPTRRAGSCAAAMRAMSMGKPTAVTNWGGHADIVDAAHAMPIAIDGLEDVPRNLPYAHGHGGQWAVPSVADTERIMKHMAQASFRREQDALGQRAREYVIANRSEEVVVRTVADRLSGIDAKLRDKKTPFIRTSNYR